MAHKARKRQWRRWPILCAVGLLALAGCGPKNYKQDADDRAYAIIDGKWEEDFGPKANYKVSDTAPASQAIRIESAVAASGVLTLPQAVAVATAANRQYQLEKETLFTTALDLRLVRHRFENQLFGGGSALWTNDGRDELIEVEANVGFNRLLAAGTQIGANVAFAWLDTIRGSGESGLALLFNGTVTQPLLRGSDPRIVLEDLTQAERDTLYAIRSFNRFRKVFVVSVTSQYYQALDLLDLARNAEQYVAALSRLEDRVNTLVAAGLLPVPELDRVRQEKLRARDIGIRMRAAYQEALDEFKITLSVAPTADCELDVSAVDALKGGTLVSPSFAQEDATEAAIMRRLDMANHADAVLDAQRKVHVAADRLRAELNLLASAKTSTDGLRSEGQAGAVVDLPLDRVPEQIDYRKALIALEQRRRDYDEAADTVRLEIRKAYRTLVETAERYQLLSEQLKLAQERIDKTYTLLEYGQVSSRRVLSAEGDLFDARNAVTEALVRYMIATLEFYRDTGVLQVRPDGMWELGKRVSSTAGAVGLR